MNMFSALKSTMQLWMVPVGLALYIDNFFRFWPLLQMANMLRICFFLFPQLKSVEELVFSPKRRKHPVPGYVKFGLLRLCLKQRLFNHTKIPDFRFPNDAVISEEELAGMPCCVPKTFDQGVSAGIIKAAKLNGVTVHSVLLAASALAFSGCSCKTAGNHYTSMGGQSSAVSAGQDSSAMSHEETFALLLIHTIKRSLIAR